MSNQETRQVTIIANQVNQNARFESSATTFGELKKEAEAEGLFDGNVRVIVRETRNELSMQDSKLPDGGFTLIVVADKVKSGAEDKYDEMNYHELRTECINRDFSSDKYNGAGVTKNVMRAHLRDDDEEKLEESNPASESNSDRFEEMKSRIEEAVAKCKSEVTGILEEYTDILPDSVIPDYSETVRAIKDELGL